jgi:hypothetical protein
VPALRDKKDNQPVTEQPGAARVSGYNSFNAVTVTLAIVILSLFICEVAVRFIVYVGKPSLTENPQYHLKYLVAKKLSNQQDNVLLMGDSLMKAGIYPELVTAKLRKINKRIRVVNLGVNGATQADAIAYLEFLRKKEVKPRLVVFDYEVSNTGNTDFNAGSNTDSSAGSDGDSSSAIKNSPAATPAPAPAAPAATPASVTAPAATNSTSVPPVPAGISASSHSVAAGHDKESKSSRSKNYLFEGLLSRPDNFWKSCDIFCSDQFYLVRYRGIIKTFIMEFLKTCTFPARFERKSFVEPRDWDDYGTTPDGMSPNHKLILETNRADQEKAIAPSHNTSPQSASYKYEPNAYEPIIEYCQQHQITLVLLWLPHQSSIYQEFYYRAPYTESWFKQQFESYAKKSYVHPIYLNTLDEDSNYFTDYRHLSTYGCVKASELFATALLEPKNVELIRAPDKKDL